jgi:hypothetical protein
LRLQIVSDGLPWPQWRSAARADAAVRPILEFRPTKNAFRHGNSNGNGNGKNTAASKRDVIARETAVMSVAATWSRASKRLRFA